MVLGRYLLFGHLDCRIGCVAWYPDCEKGGHEQKQGGGGVGGTVYHT